MHYAIHQVAVVGVGGKRKEVYKISIKQRWEVCCHHRIICCEPIQRIQIILQIRSCHRIAGANPTVAAIYISTAQKEKTFEHICSLSVCIDDRG